MLGMRESRPGHRAQTSATQGAGQRLQQQLHRTRGGQHLQEGGDSEEMTSSDASIGTQIKQYAPESSAI